ncbi:immunoglobulin kappa light chain-like [Chiloscyllium punctatum]|uniref:immunoglobulin kappa light chain-like n=1 Tax=Chiloscyllium punctatum TaxID=137246 RepID=UPI003B6402FA
MISHIQLIWPLAFCIAGINGDIIMSQSPPVLSVGLGQTATITCTASQNIDNDLSWYQQQEGQKPSLLIYGATTRFTGVSERFTGSGYNIEFTLTISNVQELDVGDYYCRENSQPKLTLLPPSTEQVDAKGTATLVCLANHFYPDELEVQWKKDGAVISDGVQTSNYLRASDSTYSVSSLLTLSGSDWESNARFSCALTHVIPPGTACSCFSRPGGGDLDNGFHNGLHQRGPTNQGQRPEITGSSVPDPSTTGPLASQLQLVAFRTLYIMQVVQLILLIFPNLTRSPQSLRFVKCSLCQLRILTDGKQTEMGQ